MPSLLRSKQQILHRARLQGVLCHPKARKINQIQKSMRRVDAKARVLNSIKAGRNRNEEQLFWIAAAMQRLGASQNSNSYLVNNGQHNNSANNPEEAPGLLPIVMEAIVHIYIHRNDKELAELKKKRQPPRGQIRKIEIQSETEMNSFINGRGFLVPPFENRADINLTMEWLETVIEFEESYAEVKRQLNDPEMDRDEKKKLKVPHLPEAYILRTSVKSSKKGNLTPTDEFMSLVNQLQNQEGIGEHLVDEDEEESKNRKNNNNGNDNDDDDDDMPTDTFFQNQSHDQGKDLAERKKKRRRFGKIRKIARSSEDGNSSTSNNGTNSAAIAGIKETNVQDMAVAGMARRLNVDKADRLKRRSLALQAARRE